MTLKNVGYGYTGGWWAPTCTRSPSYLACPAALTPSELRAKGWAAEYSYKRQALGKQLKDADRRGARKAIIFQPTAGVTVKELATGEQKSVSWDEFVSGLGRKA